MDPKVAAVPSHPRRAVTTERASTASRADVSVAGVDYWPLTGRFAAPWRWLLYGAIALLIATNLLMVALQGTLILSGSDALDWHTYVEAVARWGSPDLYQRTEWWYGWRYSPVAVPLFAPIAWMGETAWRLLHLVALAGLPGWRRLVALASYPFWFDVHAGNILIFVAVAAYWALRGNRWGIGATLLIALLVPRPFMLPLVAWIMWKEPEWRWPFAAMFVVHAALVLASGYAFDWLALLLRVGGEEAALNINAAPSALIGLWWMVAAVPLAAWAFWRGRPATAGLLLQPYWLPYYLLMPLADRWKRTTSRWCTSSGQRRTARRWSRCPSCRPASAARTCRSRRA